MVNDDVFQCLASLKCKKSFVACYTVPQSGYQWCSSAALRCILLFWSIPHAPSKVLCLPRTWSSRQVAASQVTTWSSFWTPFVSCRTNYKCNTYYIYTHTHTSRRKRYRREKMIKITASSQRGASFCIQTYQKKRSVYFGNDNPSITSASKRATATFSHIEDHRA